MTPSALGCPGTPMPAVVGELYLVSTDIWLARSRAADPAQMSV